MRLLVFGTTGQLGRELARAAWPKDTALAFLDRQAADLARPSTLPDIVREHRPDLVVIAAAYTAVDRAESEPDLAMTVNGEAPGTIAAGAAAIGVPVVHVSTDYVFDGSKPTPYTEDDPVAPLGAYGRSKEAGERAVRAANPRHVILRTAWVYSPFGANFVRTMLRLAESREEVGVVDDQIGCPTAAGDLAAAIACLAPGLGSDAPFGTYHAAGAGETTWHGFAEEVFRGLERRDLKRPRNRAITSAEYPTPARRPANSRLDASKLRSAFGLRLASYTEALPRVLDELVGTRDERKEQG
jgi:dTDP-4-dehydrorhamnose reductase